MTPKDWGTWITMGTLAAGAISRFVSLEEAKQIGRENDAGHDRALQALDERLDTVQRDSSLLVRMTAIEVQMAEQTKQMQAMSAELARLRRR